MTDTKPDNNVVLAGLGHEELENIKSQPVPVEPVKRYDCESTGWDRTDFDMVEHEDGRYVEYTDYDSLQSALKVAQQERDEITRKYAARWIEYSKMHERAEKAEASNKRMVELLKDIDLSQQGIAGHLVFEFLLEMGK